MNSRRDFLTGTGASAALLAAGYLGWSQVNCRLPASFFHVSYAQSGEDLVVWEIFKALKKPPASYLDIGAFHPIIANNTYLMYKNGVRGVLVEPNIDLIPELKQARPGDQVLNVGIGVAAEKEADFYRMSLPQRSTFSKEEADMIEAKSHKQVYIRNIVKIPLININEVIAQHFPATPSFVSLDTEGFELAILKTFDFQKHRPPVFCVDTLEADTLRQRTGILELMGAQGYVVRAGTWPNSVFVDQKLLG